MAAEDVFKTINQIKAHCQRLTGNGIDLDWPLQGEVTDLDVLAQVAHLFGFAEDGSIRPSTSWEFYVDSVACNVPNKLERAQSVTFTHLTRDGSNPSFTYTKVRPGVWMAQG